MKRVYKKILIIGFLFSWIFSPTPNVSAWTGDHPNFYFDMKDDTIITTNNITIAWHWYEAFGGGNGTLSYEVLMTTSFITTPKTIYIMNETKNLWEIPTSISFNLPDFIEPIEWQAIMFHFIFFNGQGGRYILKIIWHPLLPYRIRIEVPSYYYYIFIAVAGLTILGWAYWNTYSCRNPENIEKPQCSIKREELKRRIEMTKKQELQKKEVTKKLF